MKEKTIAELKEEIRRLKDACILLKNEARIKLPPVADLSITELVNLKEYLNRANKILNWYETKTTKEERP